MSVTISEPDAQGHRVYTVVADGQTTGFFSGLSGFAPGDVIRVPGANFSGPVLNGSTAPLAQGQVGFAWTWYYGGRLSWLSLGLDSAPGADVTISGGPDHPSNLVLAGTDIIYADPATKLTFQEQHAPVTEGNAGDITVVTYTATRSGDLSGTTSFDWSYRQP